ncbi:MAG: carboxymethylenebutenolidase [Epulopiscium sp. Nele67-Bin001]|nr:MAG: carboxymethylenebutenolidase [Epulopiscium sp. Nele67-Bin001]
MNKFKKIIIALTLLIVAAAIVFYIYVSDYYKADEVALAVYQAGLDNGHITTYNNLTIIEPLQSNDVGIIFYPGAKVEAIAYMPLLQQLADEGFSVVLVKMPFNLAFLNANAADDVLDLLKDHVSSWFIMGHSLGGGMASSYASDNPDKVDGLILIGAYIYGDYSPSNAITIYGTLNDNLEEYIDYTENIVIIDGGNHAQFGNYGAQDGDRDATISDVEQQAITVDAIMDFIF